MSLLGAIGNAIGEIFSKNQEEAAIKKADNAATREASEAKLNESTNALSEAAGSIFTQDELGANVFDELGRDLGQTAEAVGDYFEAKVKDAITDVTTTIDDVATDVGTAAKSAAESTHAIGGAIISGISNMFSVLGNAFTEGAEDSLNK